MKRREPGFSLIELLIVLAILATLIAIAVPVLLRGRMSGNERATLASMRALFSAEALYLEEPPTGVYGTLHQMRPNFFDGGFGDFPVSQPAPVGGNITYTNLRKAGYLWTVVHAATGGTYAVTVTPAVPGRTGRWSYFLDPSCVIRVTRRDGGMGQSDATAGSPPLN